MINMVKQIKEYVDMIHVSSGAVVLAKINVYPRYQIKFVEKIKQECNIPTIAVGLIDKVEMVEKILGNKRAFM